MVTLNYEFNTDNYSMDVNLNDFIKHLTNTEIVSLCEDLYNNFVTDDVKDMLLRDFDITSSKDFYKEDSGYAMKALLDFVDEDVLYKLLEDKIKDHFRSDAYDAYLLSLE